MKLVGFTTDAGPRLGFIEGDQVIDLDQSIPSCRTISVACSSSITATSSRWPSSQSGRRLRPSVRWRELPTHCRLRIPARSYASASTISITSRKARRQQHSEFPTLFDAWVNSVVAHNHPLMRPRASETLTTRRNNAVIGKRAKHMTMENALSCVAGTPAPTRARSENSSATPPSGTWERTSTIPGASAVVRQRRRATAGRQGLKIESRLNGKVMQSDNTNNMMFLVAETIVYATQGMTLEPGDLLLTGTPSGVGDARKPPAWMRAGDVIEIEIEGIGTLRNSIEDEKA